MKSDSTHYTLKIHSISTPVLLSYNFLRPWVELLHLISAVLSCYLRPTKDIMSRPVFINLRRIVWFPPCLVPPSLMFPDAHAKLMVSRDRKSRKWANVIPAQRSCAFGCIRRMMLDKLQQSVNNIRLGNSGENSAISCLSDSMTYVVKIISLIRQEVHLLLSFSCFSASKCAAVSN